MAWYLFVWNPSKDESFSNVVRQWEDDRATPRRFSCGRRLDIVPGDSAILRRTGTDSRGIVGIGTVVIGSRKEAWGDSDEVGNFVRIRWDYLSEAPLVSRDDARVASLRELWDPQSNGTVLSDDTAEFTLALVREHVAAGLALPSASELIAAWTEQPPTDKRKRMLAVHYLSPDVEMHPSYFAAKMDYPNAASANLTYGNFAGSTAGSLDIDIRDADKVFLFVEFAGSPGDVRWVLRDYVREAIEHFGWHLMFPDLLRGNYASNDAVTEQRLFRENQRMQRVVNVRGRSASIRDHCLEAHPAVCWVCKLDPVVNFGPEFRGLLEVHHLDPMAESNNERLTDPKEDCRPLCPTCHRLAHHGMPVGKCRSLEDLRKLTNG